MTTQLNGPWSAVQAPTLPVWRVTLHGGRTRQERDVFIEAPTSDEASRLALRELVCLSTSVMHDATPVMPHAGTTYYRWPDCAETLMPATES